MKVARQWTVKVTPQRLAMVPGSALIALQLFGFLSGHLFDCTMLFKFILYCKTFENVFGTGLGSIFPRNMRIEVLNIQDMPWSSVWRAAAAVTCREM
jgi:hypothetical protein